MPFLTATILHFLIATFLHFIIGADTLEDVQEYMGCKHEKAVKLLAELDIAKGVGLIDRVKQGQGKPTKIYVMKFIHRAEVLTSENQKSALPKIGGK